jgi:polynucleotide 5'-kinase involved in rRNA processing
LGPPATLGLGLFPPRRPGDDGLFPEALYFVGQTSPVGAILEVAVGCRVLADEAALRGVTRLVVNTSGLVAGPAALRLKRAELELLNPTLLLALEQDRELELLLRGLVGKAGGLTPGGLNPSGPTLPAPGDGSKGESFSGSLTPKAASPHTGGEAGNDPLFRGDQEVGGPEIIRLPVSSRLRRRNPEERRSNREDRFRRYFSRARRLTLPWRALTWEGQPWGQGEPLASPALLHLGQSLGARVLYGEAHGRRVVLLLEQPPPGHLRDLMPDLGGWDEVHWLSLSSLQLRLAGLLDGSRRTLALGLILPGPFDPQTLTLWTPLPPAAAPGVCFLKVGKMKLSLEGRELSYV